MWRDPFNQNSNRSDREKWSTSKDGPVFSKLSRLDRTDPLSFGPKFPEILVEWIAPHGLFVFPPKKTLIRRRHCSISQSFLQYGVKAKYWLISMISRKFSGIRAFAWPTKSHARLYPFAEPIKSFYFRSFVVSVLFARFHFRVYKNRSNEDLSI